MSGTVPPSEIVSFVIAVDPPSRLDKAIARDVPVEAHLSRSRLARLIADGAVTVNGAVAGARDRVDWGDRVAIVVPIPDDPETRPEDIPLSVLHEDADLIVVDKPAGMVVHPAPGSPGGTLVNALLHHFGGALSGVGGERRPGIVHRIDKDTSGLLVVAKSDAAHHGLAAQFEAHSAERRYLAVVHGVPDAGDPRLRGTRGISWEQAEILKITTRLARHRTDRQKQAVTWDGGRHAVTRARVMQGFGAAALLECWLETGRTHQIRVHMAHAGHALVGDPTYGGGRRLPRGHPGADAVVAFPRQALHARTLGFVHPVTGDDMRFASPVPDDMERLLAALAGPDGNS
ncbi:RluA family pseudouridine synthase [Jannaschia rubra]|uniref:RluA family pseudouridine synthase n=1 Tax=Jannaschia rubra TaxID=282197 RepID=UPI00248FCC56|nr:RluA family pseudouridine synthase [Jannaschia rubra]